MKNLLSLCWVFLLSISFALPVQAGGGGMTGGSTEITQFLNYGELYNQTNQSYQQLVTQYSQLQSLQQQVAAGGKFDWTQASQLIAATANTVRESQSIGYNSQVQAAQWNSLYPGFNTATGTDYFSQYKNWSQQVNQTNQAALQVNGQQVANLQTDASTRASLAQLASDANGSQSQIAAINATSQISLSTLDELSKLRQLQLSQNASQQVYLQKQNAAQDSKAQDAQSMTYSGKGMLPCMQTQTCAIKDMVVPVQ